MAQPMRLLLLLSVLLSCWAAAGASEREDGQKLLARYGWVCETNTVEMAYTVPESLRASPQNLYQSASREIGLDLAPAAGKEIIVVRYTLSRRSNATNSLLFAQVAFDKGRIIGAWLSTDAPIAPGIASLDEKAFGHDF